jgi:hypothetical protein
MTTEDIIIHIFCHVDDAMLDARKEAHETLYPSEVVSIGILLALKGGSSGRFIAGSSGILMLCLGDCPTGRPCCDS